MEKEGWVKKKLKDICQKASSNIAQNKIKDNEGIYPIYGASGYIKDVDFYQREESYIGIVKDGSGVGRVNIYPAHSSLLGTMQYIIPKADCHISYLSYLLQSLNLASFATGAAIPHIYFKDYGNCDIYLPSYPEQQQIVSELDCLQGIIEKKKEQLQELDKLAQSIFYTMFGDPVENGKGFIVKTFAEVFDLIKDGTHQTPQYTEDSVNGFKFLSSKDVVKGFVDWSHLKYIPAHLHEELYRRIKPQKGDILMSKNGVNYGIAAVVDRDEVFDIYVSLALLRPKAIYNVIYLVKAINHPCTKHQFDKSIKGIGVPNLHLTEIKKTKIILPPLSLQQEFADKITAIEQQKARIQQSLQDTETLFNSRMDYYFG